MNDMLDANSDQIQSLDKTRDRAIRLIDYLKELARIRSKTVRDIEDYQSISDYDSILWLADIPHVVRYCYTRAWGANEEHEDPDIWIEVQKFNEPDLEGIPKICEEWINWEILKNTEEIPELFATIEVREEMPNPDADPNDPESDKFITILKTLSLDDFPEVKTAWDQFVEGQWFDWRERYLEWRQVQKVYSKLFSIRQLQLKLGEKYELVLGIGFLSWKTPSGQRTRRHLITAKADLIFEARLGKFAVKPATDGVGLSVEMDMLDIEEQPPQARQAAAEDLKMALDDPWNSKAINPILASLANSFGEHGKGEYHADFMARPSYKEVQPKPIVHFAPALFLRERPERGLELALNNIKKQLQENATFPPVFLDLCEGREAKENNEDPRKKRPFLDNDGIIYFPKPYNKEQLQIVEKMKSSPGVLVQGPPGTGKSHTIANLICHLLATGRRVLVTAKTPRALQVLHGLLPEQVKPLCISLLGSGIEEQKSLEGSVQQILHKLGEWREDSAEITVARLR